MLKIELTNTSAGLTAIQRAIAGDDITFTKLVVGDGVITNPDISNLTNVVNEIKHFPLGVVKPEDEEMLRVRSNINNVGLTEDKIIREYGLFAKFGSEQEFLFAYLNSGESTTPLPKASGGRYDLNRDFVLYAGNSNNIVFDTNGDLVYATLNDIKAMDAKKENTFSKNSGFNLEKTNLTENDSNKLFTAKGALDLLNDITGRISTAISDCKNILRREMLNIKTELLALINGNTSKLENLDNNKVSKKGDIINGILKIDITADPLAKDRCYQFGGGLGVHWRMFESNSGELHLISLNGNGAKIKNHFTIGYDGDIELDNRKIQLIKTLNSLTNDKLDRTNGTYNGFLKFNLNNHGIVFSSGAGVGYKAFEDSGSGQLRIEKLANGNETGQFSYLDPDSKGRILTDVYCPTPVGGIYMASNPQNPATIWQETTWKRITGKVIVGVDEGQTEFSTVNKEGGSKIHTLTVNEMPSHGHRVRRSNNAGSSGLGNVGGRDSPDSWNTSENTGGGQPHNNLQPYITKYIWERTA